jgi:hypothetical protein
MGRYRVENGFGMLVYLQLNAAASAVFTLSRVSARDREHALGAQSNA